MRTLRKLRITGGLLLPSTRFPAAVGDQVKLFLDTDAIPEFPEYLIGIIQNPIVTSDCGSVTEYNIEYNEADLNGSAEFIRTVDVIETVLVNQIDVLSIGLDNEIAARIADVNAEEARAIAAELVLQNNITAEIAARIADVNAEEARAIADVNSEEARAIAAETVLQTNITNEVNARVADVNAEEARALAAEALLAPKASPTFTGVPLAPTAAVDTATTQLATTAFVVNQAYAKLASPALTGTPTAPTAANGDSTTQLATTAFVQGLITSGFASAPQALSGAGAVNTSTLVTCLTSTGVSQAITLADGAVGQIKIIHHVVDGGSLSLTAATRTGFSSIAFNNVGDSVFLQFYTSHGWMILMRNGVTVTP